MNRALADFHDEFDGQIGFAAPASEVAPEAYRHSVTYSGGLALRMQRERDLEAEQAKERTALRDRLERFDRRLVVARLDALLAVRAAEAGLALIKAGAK